MSIRFGLMSAGFGQSDVLIGPDGILPVTLGTMKHSTSTVKLLCSDWSWTVIDSRVKVRNYSTCIQPICHLLCNKVYLRSIVEQQPARHRSVLVVLHVDKRRQQLDGFHRLGLVARC